MFCFIHAMSMLSGSPLENRKCNSLLIQHYVYIRNKVDLFIILELRRAKRSDGAPRVKNFGKPIGPRKIGYDVSVQLTDRQPNHTHSRQGGGEASGHSLEILDDLQMQSLFIRGETLAYKMVCIDNPAFSLDLIS